MVENVIIKVQVDDGEVTELGNKLGKIPKELEGADPFKKMNNSINEQIGILEKLRQKEKELITAREKSQNPAEIKKYNAELQKTQQSISSLTAGTSKLGSAFKGAFSALGAIGVVVGLAEVVRQVVTTTATFEKYKAVLANTLGSQKAAAEAFDLIAKTAATTPFSLEQVTEAYIKLANRGLKPTELALKSFADIAASQGKDLSQFTEAALDATQGEFERLKEFGIKAQKNGEIITFAFKGIRESVENTPEAINAFLVGLGQVEGVAGSTAAISDALTGAWSNLGDNAGQLANSLGTILLPVIKGLLSAVNFLVQGFTYLFDSIDSFTSDVAAVLTGTEGVRKVTKDFEADTLAVNEAVKKESDSLNELYKSLINTTAGTEGRKKAIEALQSKYGKSIDLMGLENAGLGQIAKSQQKANQEILNAVKIKERQAIIDKLQNQIKQGYYKDDADALALIKNNIKLLQTEITDLQKVEVQTTQATKEQIKQREDAYKKYVQSLKDLQRQLQDLQNENNLNKIIDENARKRTEIAQNEFKDLQKLEEDAIKNGTQNTQEYAALRLEIEKKYQAEINKLRSEQIAKERARSQELGKDIIEIQTITQKEASKKSSEEFEKAFETREGIQSNWLDNLSKFHKEEEEKDKDRQARQIEAQKTTYAALQVVSDTAFQILAEQREENTQAELAAVATQASAEQSAIEREIELRQSQGKNTKDLEMKLAASREAQRRKEAEIKTKQAKDNKAAAIIQAIISTALAVANANTIPYPGNIPAMILAGVAGAAQIALIAAQPIPKFAKGTLSVSGGQAGKDSVPALLMPGEAVIPTRTNKLYAPAIDAIFTGKVSPKEANEALAGNQTPAVNQIVQQDQVHIHNTIDNDGLSTYFERNGNKTKILNKRYHR